MRKEKVRRILRRRLRERWGYECRKLFRWRKVITKLIKVRVLNWMHETDLHR